MGSEKSWLGLTARDVMLTTPDERDLRRELDEPALLARIAELEAENVRIRQALSDLRDHVDRYVMRWSDGGGSHLHPIWLQVAEALDAG